MRHLQRGKKEKPRANKYIMLMFLFLILLHWVTNFFYFFLKLGYTFQSVSEYFLGNPEKFLQPKTAMGLLEVTHMHLFAMGIVLVAVTHILALFPVSERFKVWLFVTAFSSAFLDIASGWLITFLSPSFTYLKMASFLTLQLSLAWVILASIFYYMKTPTVSVRKDAPEQPSKAT